MFKELREALKTEVAQAKRERRPTRRHLHLALCYLRGTAYRKCEAAPNTAPSVSWIRDLLVEHGCAEDAERSVASWLDVAPVSEQSPHPTARVLRLYVVVRADLSPGAQAVQAAHAMREFAAEYPRLEAAWHEKSNTLVMLAGADEQSLMDLATNLGHRDVPVSVFREPDLGNAVTAICVGPQGGRWLRDLPLALRESAA